MVTFGPLSGSDLPPNSHFGAQEVPCPRGDVMDTATMASNAALESRLPDGVRVRVIASGTGLDMRVLEAGWQAPARPMLLLLHGFPELAFSWRKVMPALAAAGYHVVAPDQRGYGGTAQGRIGYDADLGPFRMLNLVRDVVGLLQALGRRRVRAVVGHDFGSMVAACCALVRPDVFTSVALMSAPFGGVPTLDFARAGAVDTAPDAPGSFPPDIHEQLAALTPARRHYQWYYSTAPAAADMESCPQGLHDFLRAYYHVKSADWADNSPYELPDASAASLARMPHYYIMPATASMADAVAPHMPTAKAVANCAWLPDGDLRIYSDAFATSGLQGPLQWYRCQTTGLNSRELTVYSGRAIDVPCCFISGSSDWGHYQRPGDLSRMETTACTDYRGTHLIDGAGHWVQQEQPEAVTERLLSFLAATN